MKFILALIAALAIIGPEQVQARSLIQYLPGEGPLHNDIQDFLDLIPVTKIYKISLDYLAHDPEVRAAFKYVLTTTIIKDFLVDFEAIPEVINLLNYMQKEGVDIYAVLNKVNKRFGVDELVPPISYAYADKRTGGLKGFFKDIMKQFNYDHYITAYAKKMRNSPAFVAFIDQLKSDNFQQIVNKVYQIKSFQIILDGLRNNGVNLQIVADIMLIVLGIDVPPRVPHYSDFTERTLDEELLDFWELIPMDKYLEIILTYFEKDQQVQNAIQFIYTSEFHSLLRAVEALEEHQALVIYMHKTGFNMAVYIQSFHMTIGMENYVPPKEIENILRSEIGVQNVGGGMKAMLEDLYAILPLVEIDDLHERKLRTSKVFFNFIVMLSSPEMEKIVDNLKTHKTYKEFNRKSEEKGLLLSGIMTLFLRMIGLKDRLP